MVTNDEAIDGILKASDDVGQQLVMLTAIADMQKVSDDLKKRAVMASVGMATTSPVYELAYGVLRIARPDLMGMEDHI